MKTDSFRSDLLVYFNDFQRTIATASGDWTVKGFIDLYKNIYTVSVDTKVISKIFELMLFPVISRFAVDHQFQMILSEHQNHYPDISFITQDGTKIALDLKSTYRVSDDTAAGLTLGAFTGYFRQRRSPKNITFPYEQYAKHYVLGIIYSRAEESKEPQRIYPLDELHNIVSVVRNFTFLLQEKWRIANDQPGSGNTKNIGSIRNIKGLVEGKGPFVEHGEEVYDDYWANYLTADMARTIESKVPYRNLDEYFKWRNRPRRKKI